jgi:hypothetical protein
VFSALAAGHTVAAPDHFDIVGLRLGMSESQAREAIRKHDRRGACRTKTLHYTYHDGVSQHRTPAKLWRSTSEAARRRNLSPCSSPPAKAAAPDWRGSHLYVAEPRRQLF